MERQKPIKEGRLQPIAVVDESVRSYFPHTNAAAIGKALPLVFSSGTTHVYAGAAAVPSRAR